MKCKKCNGTGRVWDNGDKMACECQGMKPETHYEYLLRTHQEPDSNLESHHIQAPDPRDELLRECAEMLRELYNEMADWVGVDFRGETPHTKPMSKAAALLAKLEGRKC